MQKNYVQNIILLKLFYRLLNIYIYINNIEYMFIIRDKIKIIYYLNGIIIVRLNANLRL